MRCSRSSLLLVLFTGFISGCTSASRSTTAPSGDKCSVSATISSASFAHTGGLASVGITAARECSWSIRTAASWIVPERSSGEGSASVPVRVTANGTPSSRHGTLIIESTELELVQDAAPCAYDLDRTHIDAPTAGGTEAVRVTAMAGCDWSAQTSDSWLRVAGGVPASGTGVVQLFVAANTGPARQGSAAIAGHTVAVMQAGPDPTPPTASPSPTPAPSPTPPPSPPPPTKPSPPPSPPPPPPPRPDEPVELEGSVSGLRGSCPNLTFNVSGVTVLTDNSTKYRAGNCKHVENGRKISVAGRWEAGDRLRAEQIDLKTK